ncbi:MAG: hypothetical protein UHH87_10810 [Akkermansia sp.]|nr:hypothetical protein [Akkermansia sp.]MEE1266766.1 hypothetical protein [Akkermansia sp.]
MAPRQRAENKKMLGLYVDSALVAKFQQACAYYGQTMTSAVTLFIEETVQEYEELMKEEGDEK